MPSYLRKILAPKRIVLLAEVLKEEGGYPLVLESSKGVCSPLKFASNSCHVVPLRSSIVLDQEGMPKSTRL